MKRLILLVAAGLIATASLAHSPLTSTAPENAAIIAATPAQISMRFQKDIRLTRVTVSHADAKAEDMDIAGYSQFTTDFELPLRDRGSGAYVIEWRGLGNDGHAMQGSFSFTVK